MFNLEDFKDSLILEKVEKLNKLLSKNKISKVSNIINELENLLDNPNHAVQISYVLSILAEYNVDLIPEGLIEKIPSFLLSDNIKLKTNSLIIIGFAMLANSEYVQKYLKQFIVFLKDSSEDIRDNIHYFLQGLVKKDPNSVNSFIDILLESLLIEKGKENTFSLLNILKNCNELSFDQLYNFREVIKQVLSSFQNRENSNIITKAISLIKKYFPETIDFNIETQDKEVVESLLNKQFIMKKHNFTDIKKKTGIYLKEYIKKHINTSLSEEKIYFYTKTKEEVVFLYELEKSKLNNFFEQESKISNDEILKIFSQIIKNDSELKIFVKTLIKLNIISGYFSELGYFYPYHHIKSRIVKDFQQSGEINRSQYSFLPPRFINKIIQDISNSTNQKFLRSRDQKLLYSLKRIRKQINVVAAKQSIVDLKSNRSKLIDEDFIKLIKNLPRDYLSHYRKGTQWLTNLGTLKIKEEIKNSKIVGFFNISKISKRLSIGQILLIDVFDHLVDSRSGIWDNNRDVFYYSKYLKEKINEISGISDEKEKLEQINAISKDLNIDKNHILAKIDENLKLIAEEIKEKDQIRISEYIDKTGMEMNLFIKFVEEIGVPYFKKADYLIFNPQKIEEAKNDIKFMLIDKSKSDDYISLGTFEITSHLIGDLINSLYADGKLKGIFHEVDGEVLFFTERGIRKQMQENSFLFSFNDIFYGKELSKEEINLMREIFDDLIKKQKIKGNFDEESLTFSSDEVLFAQDYNSVLFEFEKMMHSYLNQFDLEFQKIKRLLTKKEETIFPQEIKLIQEIIDRINEKYVWWRSVLDAYINKANKKLLKDQGVSVKQYKTLFSKEKKDEIKSLEEDPEVYELLDKFKTWVSIFNRLELKYPNVIFYQKRLITNPKDGESNNKLDQLLDELYLV